MKTLALALVLIVVLAFAAQHQEKSASVVVCGEVHGGTVMTSKGVEWAEDFGTWLHDLAETPVGPDTVKATVKAVEKVLYYWARTWFLSSKGLNLDPEILQLQQQAEAARAAAESQCTPCPQALPQDSSPLASLGAAVPTGSPEEITRQVAARYWPADQVDTAVAIAGAESTYNPKAHNNYGSGVDGLWQINRQAHPDLIAGKNLQDPSVNAALAYQIWKDAGNSWTPWTTYTSGSYKKFLKPSTAAQLTAAVQDGSKGLNVMTPPASDSGDSKVMTSPAAPTNPQNVGCQSAGMPELRVATWNSYYGARHPGTDGLIGQARIVFAMQKIGAQSDLIGTQEMSEASHKEAAQSGLGDEWAAVGLNTSHPIWYRKAKFSLIDSSEQKVFERGTPMEGPDQGTRYIVSAVLRDNASGKTITAINFHQIPTIEKSGKLNPREPKRSAVAREIFAAAMTQARMSMARGAVVVTADTNFSTDPEGAYKAAGLTSVADVLGAPDQKSRSRDIDKILYSAGAPSSFRSLGQLGSDHQARVAIFAGNDSAPASRAAVAGMRSVTDPTSHKTYQVQIPAGPRGVAINFAIEQLGKPYVFGSRGPNSYDCSSLISAAYAKAGIKLTPQTESMYREIPHTSSPQPGDIAYHPGHVQLVLNDGLILEAANPRVPLRIIDKNWMKPTAYFDPTKMETA